MKVYTTKVKNLIPKEVRQWPQWVAWRWEWNRKAKKWNKVPINPKTGKRASISSPATWGSFEEACEYASECYAAGIGFVFTPDDPYCGVDLDECIDPDTGEARLGVEDVLDSLDSYAEISPSGVGIKAIVRAVKPGDRCSTSNTLWGGSFELYDQERFFTITGNVYRDAPIRDAQEAIDELYAEFFPEARPGPLEELRMPSTGFPGSDEELLESVRNNPRKGSKFRKLYDHGNWEGYASRSEADQALCNMLAWWTGCDRERIKRLFLGSSLARGKYAEKGRYGEKYLDGTINEAIRNCLGTYDPQYGDMMKAQVREIVAWHRSKLSGADIRETKRRVMGYMLTIAATCGRLKNGDVEFNANQEEIAEIISISQRGVSGIIRELVAEGWLLRISVGKPGKNSFYRLPAVEPRSTTYVAQAGGVPSKNGKSSNTYGKNNPPVKIGSRTKDKKDEVSAPTVGQRREIVRNLPPISAEGVYEHGPECRCGWTCDPDAPEYLPADDLGEVA